MSLNFPWRTQARVGGQTQPICVRLRRSLEFAGGQGLAIYVIFILNSEPVESARPRSLRQRQFGTETDAGN
jgi:hypothetical protein